MEMVFSELNPANTRIGWVGTGVMGDAMCGHLLSAGYQVSVFNRSKEKTKGVFERGATISESIADLACGSDIVFSIVGYPEDVREVYCGSRGLIDNMASGGILVDMTTSQPNLAKELYALASNRGVHCLDAPVSGGDIGAKEARLSIMVGGDHAVFLRVQPLFAVMGKTIVYQGGAGAGQHTKMVNQILIANNMVGVCEALLYAYRSGLDIETVLQSVSSGAAGSWSLSNLAPRMLKGDFQPGFFVDHFVKDMGIALEEASHMRLSLPGLSLAKQLYEALRAQGGGREGTQALVKALAKLNDISW